MSAPSDRVARTAALWATLVALPVAVLAGVLIFSTLSGGSAAAPRQTAPSLSPVPVPSGPVTMPAPALPARAAAVCRTALQRLPAALRGLPRRTVTAGPAQNAAYGEPAITLACGVPQPPMCPSERQTGPGCVPWDTELLNMNRICWYAQRGGAANTFTTMDREIPVRVTVPALYEQAAQWVNEFSPALAGEDDTRASGVPSGCV